jgi:hypothetical protein
MNSCVVLTTSAFLLGLFYDSKMLKMEAKSSSETSVFLQTAWGYKHENRSHILYCSQSYNFTAINLINDRFTN